MDIVRSDRIAAAPIDVEAEGRDAVFERFAATIATFPVARMKQSKRFRLHRISAQGAIRGLSFRFGWGVPDGPESIGASGLVCFSQHGEKLWEFPMERGVSDCYALNVSGTDVWIYYYVDFPI